MIKIEYPLYQPKIKMVDNKELIFDNLRKQWILLTPEEWVRQNFLQYLIQIKNYPSSLIAIEKTIQLNGLKKRFDIVVYNKLLHPWMVIECKEMGVSLNQNVLDQVIRYNMVLQAAYMVITNGTSCYCYGTSNNQILVMNELPEF